LTSDKNTLIAFALIALVLILMPYYFEKVSPTPPQPPKSETEMVRESQAVPIEAKQAAIIEEDDDVTLENIGAKSLEIVTDKYSLTLSNLGGGNIEKFVLFDYLDTDGQPVVLFDRNKSGNLSLSLLSHTYGDTINTQFTPFTSTNFDLYDDGATVNISGRYEIDFEHILSKDKIIRKKFIFYNGQYHFDMVVELVGFQNKIPDQTYSIHWKSGFDITEKNKRDDLEYSYLYSMAGSELLELHLKDKFQSERMLGEVKWMSVRSKYFTAAVIPSSGTGSAATLSGFRDDNKRYAQATLEMKFSNLSRHTDSYQIMIGPLDDSYLSSFNIGLENIMNWGWKVIQPISFAVLWSIKFLHKFIPNYGLVLIIFSILIKILLYPLTHKSYESMKRMQELQPVMKELQEKHKNNPQQLNKEMMATYKKYKVNPLGGCLPMLLQMPLLYALFIIFRTTIELRQANFTLWITDLSSPDYVIHLPFTIPLYGDAIAILPIVMAVTMIFQQKLTSSAQSNPQQKMMIYFMPVFFLLLFNNFPSGLNLYYTLFNVLTILQQKFFINPSINIEPVESSSRSKKK
jgi:YidC/Oxa1 family membrane protein insertase